MTVVIRPPEARDRAQWAALYAGCAAFHEVAQTAEMRAAVWGWLHDPASTLEGRVAEDGAGRLVGLAHFRPHLRPLSAATEGFLEDLFVAPEARGKGVAEALIGAVAEVGRARGWSVLRVIAAEDNARARRLCDRVARRTGWVTYDIPLGAPG
jgi:GNAT superfamily N-acetyltransferase